MRLKSNILAACVFAVLSTFADITVSDVKVFSGYPWKEVVVGYTIAGTDAEADFIRLTATDKSANKTYIARSLTGAELTEGRHVLRWNPAAEGVKFSSANMVFSVSIVSMDEGVQLWANGPYWAECNVGATKPEECGYYFWWGDTIGYKRNASDNGWVSALNGESFSFNGDNCPTTHKNGLQLELEGYVNSVGCLAAKYDAATKHLGSRWRMPTRFEWNALMSKCTMKWTMLNGIFGRLVTGKGAYATNSIFLPAAGEGYEDRLLRGDTGLTGFYWSSTYEPDFTSWHMYFCHTEAWRDNVTSCGRYYGCLVRPVRGFVQ